MSLSVDSIGACGEDWEMRSGGKGGSGLSTILELSGMDRSTGAIELMVESESDSAGSSKDTV